MYPVKGQASEGEIPPEQPAEPEVPAEPAISNVVELPKPAEPVVVAETPKPPAEPAEDLTYWKKRFETVQGKLNSEMPQLYQQLREQSQQIQALVSQLQERKAEPTPEPQSSLVTPKDVEDYGADLVDFNRRVALDTTRSELANLEARLRKEFGVVQDQVSQVSNQVYQSEYDKFWGGVMNLVPDWKQIDQDPNWVAFLDTTPEFAEDTYRELAGKAIAKGDAQKIAKLVSVWRGPQQSAPLPTPAPAPAQPDMQAELQRQIAPSTSRASAPPQPAGKIWSGADYEAAYDVRNVARFGEKEANRLISEADRAVAEGRVRW